MSGYVPSPTAFFKKNKKFDEANVNDKCFVDIDVLNDEQYYSSAKIKLIYIELLATRMLLVLLKQEEYFESTKQSICDIQHKCQNKLFPNVYSIETLSDEEFSEIIKRLQLANKTVEFLSKCAKDEGVEQSE